MLNVVKGKKGKGMKNKIKNRSIVAKLSVVKFDPIPQFTAKIS
jgi:hypothetical protein